MALIRPISHASASPIVWVLDTSHSSWGQTFNDYTHNTFYLDNVDSFTEADYTHRGDSFINVSLDQSTHRLTVATKYSSVSNASKTITITPLQS